MDRNHIKSVFAEYTDRFNASDIKIRLKIDHTYRVADISDRIARSLTSEASEIDLAWLLGMLHDIGRFEQLKRYGTFVDAHSIDHAQFGADLLFKEGLFDQFIAKDDLLDDRILIETAIRLHNKYRLPRDLDDRMKMFCQILRDADKIDILKVQVDIPFEDIHPGSKDDLYNSDVRDIFMDYVYRHCCASREVIGERTAAESYMSHCMLAFELVYDESRRITAEQGYLAQLLTFRSNNPATQEKYLILKRELEQSVLTAYQ